MKKLALAAAAALALIACSKKEEASAVSSQAANVPKAAAKAETPLHFVPAGTAYVFAPLEAAPKDLVLLSKRFMDLVSAGLQESLSRAIEKTSEISDPEEAARAKAMLELARDKWSGGPESIGLSYNSLGALYEINSLPVVRLELQDVAKFKDFIKELETRLGKPFQTATVDGQEYWRFPLEEPEAAAAEGKKSFQAEAVVAVVGNHMVAAIHTPLADTSVQTLLGLQKPQQTILDTGDLQAVNKEFGLKPYGTLLFKPQVLAQQWLGAAGQETWITRLANPGQTLSDICRTEVNALVGKMPRLVAGYTEAKADKFETKMVAELEPTLAKQLSELPVGVPGLGASTAKSFMDVGVGLDLNKLATFVQTQAAAVKAAPFQCELLTNLNEQAGQVGEQLAGLYMAAGWVNGLRMNLTELNLEQMLFKGTLLISSPSPQGLVGMAQGFVPELAALSIAPGGEPQQIPADAIPPGLLNEGDQVWVAMTDKVVGLGIGAGDTVKKALEGDLKASVPSQPPLMSAQLSGEFYAKMLEDMEDQLDDEEIYGDPTLDFILKPLVAGMPMLYKQIETEQSQYLLTEKGLEVRSSMTMKKQ